MKTDLETALKSAGLKQVGYTTYSPRRAAACAFASLCSSHAGINVKTAIKDDLVRARLKNNFGWVPASEMIIHYCKGAQPLSIEESRFWIPLYMFVMHGFLRSECGFQFPNIKSAVMINTSTSIGPRAIKTRGRPKKQQLPIASIQQVPLSQQDDIVVEKKARGRPKGSKNKKKEKHAYGPKVTKNRRRARKRAARRRAGLKVSKKWKKR
jgi:hypothetical protein